jgi:hypothetical protein
MKSKAVLTALAIITLIFAGPSISQGDPIVDVSIDIPGGLFAGPFTLAGWGPFPVPLAFGQNLILTQTGPSHNFDTSECGPGGVGGCPGVIPQVTVNGNTFADTTLVLTAGGNDPGTSDFVESSDWVLIGTVPGAFNVYVAYADNAHIGATGALPNPWQGSPGDIFRGAAQPGGCLIGVDPCFDSGAIRIQGLQAVPAPATLVLLGASLLGVAVWRRRAAHDGVA